MKKCKTAEELYQKLVEIVEVNSDKFGFGTDYDAIAGEIIDLLYSAGYLKRFKTKR